MLKIGIFYTYFGPRAGPGPAFWKCGPAQAGPWEPRPAVGRPKRRGPALGRAGPQKSAAPGNPGVDVFLKNFLTKNRFVKARKKLHFFIIEKYFIIKKWFFDLKS